MDSAARRALAAQEILADMTHVGRFSEHLLRRPLRRYQHEVAAAVVNSVLLGQGRTFAVMMSRQAGKNETSAHIEAFLMNYFRRQGGNIVKVSPTFKPQTINSLLRLESLYEGSALPPAESQHGYMLRVGRARCSFYSGAPGANVVGATADLLLEADEAQDLDPVKWNKEFRPMGASTNVTSVLWGTAWTRDTLLANTIRALRAEEAQDGHRRVFCVPWQEVAGEVPAYGAYVRGEIARLGEDHPLVRTQYALEELDARGGMFAPGVRAMMRGDHPRRRSPLDRLAPHILTIDVGGAAEEQTPGSLLLDAPTRHDATALTVFRVEYGAGGLPRYLVQDRYHWTGQPHHALLPTIVRLAEVWSAEQVILDATGLGQGLASFLETHLGERLTPFVFTSTSKSELGWDFLALCASGRFLDHAPDGSPEQAQFWREVDAADYSVVPGVARRMRWGVADPRTHDDLLVSAALVAAARPVAVPADPAIIEAGDPLTPRDRLERYRQQSADDAIGSPSSGARGPPGRPRHGRPIFVPLESRSSASAKGAFIMTAITEQPMPEYTPLFLWVINATGDTHAAGVHGVIYRRAQPTDGECEITAEDIAKKTHLPLEQVEWHIDTLIDRGIVRCSMEPTGARRFTLVSEEEWTAEFGGRVLPPVWDTDLEANVDLEADTDL